MRSTTKVVAWWVAVFLCLADADAAARRQKNSRRIESPPARAAAAKPATGTLVLATDAAGAEIFLDGKSRGRTTAAGTLAAPLVLAPGTHRLEVVHPDYRRFVQAVRIAAGRPTQVRVVLEAVVGTVSLNFAQAYPGKTVTLDGELLAATDGPVKVPVGKHALRVTCPGFEPFAAEIEIAPGRAVVLPVTLDRTATRIVVTGPAGARVYLDGADRGVVPQSGELILSAVPSERKPMLVVEKTGFARFERTLDLADGAPVAVAVRLDPLPVATEFADTFLSLDFWDAPAGWSADRGVLRVAPADRIGLVRDKWFGDGDIVFGLRLTDGRGAAWVLRAQDGDRYYLFRLSGPDGAAPHTFQTFLCRAGDPRPGRPIIPPQPLPVRLGAGDALRVRIRLDGNTIQHWITPSRAGEEISVGYFQDPDATYPAGRIGFATPDRESFHVNGLVFTPRQKP